MAYAFLSMSYALAYTDNRDTLKNINRAIKEIEQSGDAQDRLRLATLLARTQEIEARQESILSTAKFVEENKELAIKKATSSQKHWDTMLPLVKV